MAEHPTRCCKVGRVAAEHEIEDWTESLVTEWQDGSSVRSLADRFNKSVIDSALDDASTLQSEWTKEPLKDLFLSESTDQSDEIEMRRELERAGVDVDHLEATFVSHQTLYRHFTKCLDASKDTSLTPTNRIDSARETIFSLQRRTQMVTESTITELDRAEIVDIGDSSVIVDIQVLCEECGRSMDVQTVLSEGCDCQTAGRPKDDH